MTQKPLTLAVVGGLGIMASPMARHWKKGGPVQVRYVHDRGHHSPERDFRREGWRAHGAQLVATLSELGVGNGDVDGVFICAGKNGDDLPLIGDLVRDAKRAGHPPFIVHLSTVSTGFAERATQFARSHGVAYVNYPLTGGSVGAEKGTMLILGGGDETLFQRLQSALSGIGNPRYFGASPSAGAEVKFMGHMMVFNGLMGISSAAAAHAECFEAGKLGGTGQGDFFDFLNAGAGGTRQWDVALSLGVKQAIWDRGFSARFGAVDAIYTASFLLEKKISRLCVRSVMNIAYALSFVMNKRGDDLATHSIVREFISERATELDAFVEKHGGFESDPRKQLEACVASFPADVREVVRLNVSTDDFERG